MQRTVTNCNDDQAFLRVKEGACQEHWRSIVYMSTPIKKENKQLVE